MYDLPVREEIADYVEARDGIFRKYEVILLFEVNSIAIGKIYS